MSMCGFDVPRKSFSIQQERESVATESEQKSGATESELFPLLSGAIYYCNPGTECSGSKVKADHIDTWIF